jgi:hypothetical protein
MLLYYRTIWKPYCTLWTKHTVTNRYSTLCTRLLIYLLTYLPRTDAPIGVTTDMFIRRDKGENAVQSKSLGIVSWLRFLMRTFPLSPNINRIKERRQDQSYFFLEVWATGTRARATKTVLSSVSGKSGFCSTGTKQDRRRGQGPKVCI